MGVLQLFAHPKEYFIVREKTPQQSQLWATQWPFLYDFVQKINSRGLNPLYVKVAQWKKRLCKILNIHKIWIFPPNNWESVFCFGFCKEDYWVPHWKTWAQLTPSNLKTEKESS
jgi:hypothetical protein